MIQLIVVLLALILVCAVAAIWLKATRQLTWRQALFYLPLKLAYRVDDHSIREAQNAAPAVIYVIAHQSRLDPALMLSLLPEDTLHILDAESANSAWLEPWRALARTITFNTEHLFISRRLVRHLRGRGRLAVYLPALEDPTPPRLQSLYRAVARIAGRGDASVVAIHVHGRRTNPPDVIRADAVHFGMLPRLTIKALAPIKLSDFAGTDAGKATSSPSAVLIARAREAADPKA